MTKLGDVSCPVVTVVSLTPVQPSIVLPPFDPVWRLKDPCGSVVGGVLNGDTVNEKVDVPDVDIRLRTVIVIVLSITSSFSEHPRLPAAPYIIIEPYG